MTRSELINTIIRKNNYKTYLEIGVNTPAQPGWSHDNIKIDIKHGVDPSEKVNTTFKMTSDEFFSKHINVKYDIVFVDGLHLFEQAHRDIINSLKWLNDGGTVVVHDCNPITEITQRREKQVGPWHGDVWKAILKLRIENPNIIIYTVNTDEGCAIIQKGSQKLFISPKQDLEHLDFDYFDANRKEILNLISVIDFKKKINSYSFIDPLIEKTKKIYGKLQFKKTKIVLRTILRITKNTFLLRFKKNIKLNLGAASTRMGDYINIDSLFWKETDLLCELKHLPYFVKNGSASHIYASHVLEHFIINDVKKILRISYDTLQNSGEIRISVPDFDKIAKLYLDKKEEFKLKDPITWQGVVYGGQTYSNNFHKTGFTYHFLEQLLEEAGFNDVKEYDAEKFLAQYNIKDSSLYKKEFGEYISLNMVAKKII